MLGLLLLTTHVVSGFIPGNAFAVYIDDVPQLSVVVSDQGTVYFETKRGVTFRVGLLATPIDGEDGPAPGVPAAELFSVRATPNPASGPVRVIVNLPVGGPSSARVELFSPSGQLVGEVSTVLVSPGVHEIAYDAERLPTGMYFLRVDGGTQQLTERLLIVH